MKRLEITEAILQQLVEEGEADFLRYVGFYVVTVNEPGAETPPAFIN